MAAWWSAGLRRVMEVLLLGAGLGLTIARHPTPNHPHGKQKVGKGFEQDSKEDGPAITTTLEKRLSQIWFRSMVP